MFPIGGVYPHPGTITRRPRDSTPESEELLYAGCQRKQSTAALSRTESEYIAMILTTPKRSASSLFGKLNVNTPCRTKCPAILQMDNQAAFYTIEEPNDQARQQTIQFSCARKLPMDLLSLISTLSLTEQAADGPTKPFNQGTICTFWIYQFEWMVLLALGAVQRTKIHCYFPVPKMGFTYVAKT